MVGFHFEHSLSVMHGRTRGEITRSTRATTQGRCDAGLTVIKSISALGFPAIFPNVLPSQSQPGLGRVAFYHGKILTFYKNKLFLSDNHKHITYIKWQKLNARQSLRKESGQSTDGSAWLVCIQKG